MVPLIRWFRRFNHGGSHRRLLRGEVILKHLEVWESQARLPSKKNISPCTGEPIPEECLSRTAETMYDNVDQVYEE